MKPSAFPQNAPTGSRGCPKVLRAGVWLAFLAQLLVIAVGPYPSRAQSSEPSAASSAPDGYMRVESPALPDRLVEITADSTFSIRLDREVADREHRRMIQVAERLVPTTEHIDAILEAGHGPHMTRGNWPNRLKAARDAEADHGPRWWWMEWDHVFLPVALGAPAVHHYVEVMRSRAVEPNPFGSEVDRGHLTYSATVERVEGERAGETPWVAVLKVTFSYWCGGRCALSFEHDRRVYFDPSGEAVRVEGDRVPSTLVS